MKSIIKISAALLLLFLAVSCQVHIPLTAIPEGHAVIGSFLYVRLGSSLTEIEWYESLISILLTSVIALILIIVTMFVVIHTYHKQVAAAQKKLIEEERKREEQISRIATSKLDQDELISSLVKLPRYINDSEWQRLEASIDSIYDGWCTSLRKEGLTPGNIRIACLTKLHFSNNDCATILGISPSSVTKSRQRLKEKLK